MTQPIRKIIVAHYRPDIVSGAENSIADFVDQIDPRFQITMLVPGEGNLARFYRKRGFNVWIRPVETPRRLRPGLHRIQSLLLARALKQRGVDAVLCNTFPSASRVATACRIAGLPYAIYLRDYTPDTPLHRRILRQANGLFAISNDVIQHHQHMADPAQFHLAYNFINPDPILSRQSAHLASGKRLLPFPAEYPVVGLVGRITPYKQPDLFVRAIPHVLREIPQARFVLVGSAQQREKTYENSLKTLAETLGVSEKVQFMGQRRDAVEVTSEFAVACLASSREPLGRVVLEAQLLGVPVVVPDAGGPAEIVKHELTGLCFDSSAAEGEIGLARAVIRLLNDQELRECLADEAQKHVNTTFASRRHVEIQEKYIDRLCDAFTQQ
jgi:glycosyltransferase involved in cell wall biosynthesis